MVSSMKVTSIWQGFRLPGLALFTLMLNACVAGDIEEVKETEQPEFIAELSDFEGYENWESIDYTVGVTNRFLTDGIHSSGNNDFVRRVIANDVALKSDGESYDNGSILIKETFTYANDDLNKEFAIPGGLLAMVKRGGDYSPNGGGWEWFNLAADLSQFNARGIDVRMGTCLSCHALAQLDEEGVVTGGNDFVFAHSSEVIADNDTFAGYRTWDVIDVVTEVSDLLAGRAHGAAVDGSTRTVFKKQLFANPDTLEEGYPIGTVLVKEIADADDNITGVVAMVKRGADFAVGGGDWEWFILEAETGAIVDDEDGQPRRGAMLNDGGCVGCHTAATSAGVGIDFVFQHADDPFNKASDEG